MTTEYSAETQAVMGGYGITPTASGGWAADPNDLKVYTGTQTSMFKKGENFPFKGQTIPAAPTTTDATKTQSQLEQEFYAKSPDDLQELQKRLYAAGFYGNYDVDKIVLGVHDEVSFKAWSTAVARAAAFYQAGQKKTIDDVIDESAGVLDQIYGKGNRRGGDGRERAPLTIGLTSPDDLRAVAQRTATGTIGRALTESELNQFVASFHQAQSQSQTNAYNAAESGGTITGTPSADVAAEQFARQQAPTEAGGNDFLRTYQAFANILSRRA